MVAMGGWLWRSSGRATCTGYKSGAAHLRCVALGHVSFCLTLMPAGEAEKVNPKLDGQCESGFCEC